MSVNEMEAAAYPMNLAEAAAERSFANTMNKAARSRKISKETDAFRPESSDKVMRAWDKALAETGVNPFPMNRISTALVLHVEGGRQETCSAFLGE